MKSASAVAATLCIVSTAVFAQDAPPRDRSSVAPKTMQAIAPGLADYTDNTLFGDVWARPDLSPRDRSLVTLSALIATGKAVQLPNHLRRGLDNGLKPGEIAAMATHLAFCTGWPNAVSALDAIEPVFAERKVDMATLQVSATARSPVSSATTARSVDTTIETFAPKLAQLTNDVLLDDLWQRGDLTRRDRSLITIIAYAATGDSAQLPSHLRRGIENGLTRPQIAEAFTHLAFYAGWPKAVAAVRAFGETMTNETPTGRLEIHRPGTDPRAKPTDTFTGSVTVASAFKGSGGAALGGATVSFRRGARSNWHTHPLGQLLVVTSGHGWVQAEGQAVRVMSAGDVVWTPPGVRHWHGATRDSDVTHVAIAEAQDGKTVTWLERVADTQYQGPPGDSPASPDR